VRSKEDVEADLALYFSKEKELEPDERKRLLMSIFDKHLILNTSDFKVDFYDFQKIRSDTMTMYSSEKTKLRMDRKDLSDQEVVQLFLLESFTGFLNNKGALKRMPRFNKE
jgi:hypothetical protein